MSIQSNIFLLSLSVKQGVFPKSLKTTHVSPIFKNDEKFLFTNYRMISVLPCFSKFLNPVMFADDTNLFLFNKNSSKLFKIAIEELTEMNEWFRTNKFSINKGETIFS